MESISRLRSNSDFMVYLRELREAKQDNLERFPFELESERDLWHLRGMVEAFDYALSLSDSAAYILRNEDLSDE